MMSVHTRIYMLSSTSSFGITIKLRAK